MILLSFLIIFVCASAFCGCVSAKDDSADPLDPISTAPISQLIVPTEIPKQIQSNVPVLGLLAGLGAAALLFRRK